MLYWWKWRGVWQKAIMWIKRRNWNDIEKIEEEKAYMSLAEAYVRVGTHHTLHLKTSMCGLEHFLRLFWLKNKLIFIFISLILSLCGCVCVCRNLSYLLFSHSTRRLSMGPSNAYTLAEFIVRHVWYYTKEIDIAQVKTKMSRCQNSYSIHDGGVRSISSKEKY